METIARLRDGTDVAAWLFKANPVVWDVVSAIGAGEPIESWPMVDNYRVGLVHPGHPCVLWVTGGRNAKTTGVWAIGEVTSEPHREPSERHGSDQPWVGFDLDFLDAPVRLIDLVGDERFSGAEIIRAPRVSSPVALTGDEFTAILDAWPE